MKTAFLLSILLWLVAALGEDIPGQKIAVDPSSVFLNAKDESSQLYTEAQLADYLLHAANKGMLDEVKKAIAAGAPINARDSNAGNTPLMWACFNKHISVASVLIQKGATVDALSSDGNKSPLIMSAFVGDAETADMLLRRGANVDLANSRGDTAMSLAAYRGHVGVVKVLLSRRPTLGLSTLHDGFTAVHIACERGEYDIAKLMFEYDPSAAAYTDIYGNTPCMLAARKGLLKIVELCYIHAHESLSITNHQGMNVLTLAVVKKQIPVIAYILDLMSLADPRVDIDINARSVTGDSALHYAAGLGLKDAVELLLSHDAGTRVRNNSGMTAKQVAEQRSHLPVVALILSVDRDA